MNRKIFRQAALIIVVFSLVFYGQQAHALSTPCEGDLNGDGVVDLRDYRYVYSLEDFVNFQENFYCGYWR